MAILLLAVMFAASGAALCASVRDDIGACLSQPDGATITLPCEEVLWHGKSGKSFAIKEWTEKYDAPAKPRLVVVSTKPLTVDKYWSVDVTGGHDHLSKLHQGYSQLQQPQLADDA